MISTSAVAEGPLEAPGMRVHPPRELRHVPLAAHH
jgi:hypothetical protein